jgi:hypothetical protein
VRSLEELRDGEGYVVGNERFKDVGYTKPVERKRFSAFSKSQLVLPNLKDNPIKERKMGQRSELLGEEGPRASEVALFDAAVSCY